MKKIIIFLLAFLGFLSNVKAIDFNLNSKNAILYNLDEDTILYEKDSEKQTFIASLTKIMTAIVTVENISNLDETVTLTYDDFAGLVEADASVAGFYVGEEVTIRDLLYGLLLPSGADAAQALTRIVAGSRDEFVNLMNDKATELGLLNTHFVNETGLHDNNHYLKEIFSNPTYTISDNSKSFFSTVMAYKNSYNLEMDYLIGGKTGTTDEAGLCLATFALGGNTNYLLVTTGAEGDGGHIKDAKTIYDYFISHYDTYEVISDKDLILSLKTVNSKEKEVVFYANKTLNKYLAKDFNKKDLFYQYEGVEKVNYFTKVGTKLGTVRVILNDEVIDNIDIILNEKLTFSLMAFLINYWYGVVIILLIVIFTFIMIKKKR